MSRLLKRLGRHTVEETKAYELLPNPEPLESDNDPLFDSAAFAPTPPRKKGRKLRSIPQPPAEESAEHVGRSNKSAGAAIHITRRDKPRVPRTHTPFAQYFAGLSMKLASDDEMQEEGDLEEDTSGSHADDESDRDWPAVSLGSGMNTRKEISDSSQVTDSSKILRVSVGLSAARRNISKGFESEDSDGDILPKPRKLGYPYRRDHPPNRSSKRKSAEGQSPPAKKMKVEENNEVAKSGTSPPKIETDASVTEPETEGSVTEPESEHVQSETEPETDAELPQMNLKPRPEIERKEDQPVLGPFVLDDGMTLTPRKKVQVPGSINTFLRDYQRDGVRFLWDRFKNSHGGLLGDDMGLGKTIQVISFLSAIMRKFGDNRDANRRHDHVSRLQDGEDWKRRRSLPTANATWPTCLVIAPSSVVPNWEREFEKWGYFEVGVYGTGKEDRSEVLKDFKYGRLDVVITTFDLARRDIALLDNLAWSCIIVDEVHRVKNPHSKLTDAFNDFHCEVRFGLTGTAIQNSFSELWTILNWSNPGSVGTKKEWESYVSKPLLRGQSKSATGKELSDAYEIARILRDIVLPKFFLRRTKELIKDQLPEKSDEVVFCPLTPTQIEVYKRVLNTKAVRNLIRKDEPCDCGSKKLRKSCCHKSDQGDLFKYMSALIKISNHLALILPAPSDTSDQVIRNRQLAEEIFPQRSMPKFGTAMLLPQYCGKWMVLESLLKEWRADLSNKVLIFTKSVKLLDMLDFHLRSQGLEHVRLDGNVKQGDRMPLIDKFNEDPEVFIFLISTLAGGTGLNLTGANKVVIFDPNWNPAHDLQAMDRAYRFGQTRNVSVYRLLAAGSVEELIYARQVYKQQQMAIGYTDSMQTRYFEGVQGDKMKQGELFGIKNIFKLHEETLATKMAIEKATMSDLDWALANIKPDYKPETTKWVYEAESKAKKDHGDLTGLGALLFDDVVTPKTQDEDRIQKTLKDIGVQYIHRNEDLIAENVIQRQKMKHIIVEEKKKAQDTTNASRSRGKAGLVRKKTWPPRRAHHKPAPTPAQKLHARQKALLDLGIIETVDHLSNFAQEFARKSRDEQNEILSKLDHYALKT